MRYKLHAAVLAFYTLLTFIILHPLLLHNGTHAAGYDYFHFHWNFWWIREALSSGQSIYTTDYVMFPFVSNLSYHTLTVFWYPVWAALEPITGTFTAMNVIIALGSVFNGYAFFLLLHRQRVLLGLCLIGGAALQVTPLVRYFYFNTHINLMDWFWLPVHLMLWQQVAKGTQRAAIWAVIQGIGLWAMMHTDLQFALFLAFVLVPYGLYTFIRSRNRKALIGWALLANGVALLLLWFVGPLPYILSFEGSFAAGSALQRPGIPFPRGYLTVDDVWWWWNVPTLGGFVAFAVIGALVASFTRWRYRMPLERWLWFVLMLPPFVLSMGPTISVAGRDIAMPYRALYEATDGLFAMPWRLAPIYVIAGMVFAGQSFTLILQQLHDRSRVFVLAGMFLLLAGSLRLYHAGPVQPIVPEYDFYTAIGDEPYDDYVILEVPTAAGSGEILIGDERTIALQLYAITHGRKLVNGFIARAPLEHFWYLRTDDPLLSWLGQRRDLEADIVLAQLQRIIYEWPVGYIIVHQDLIGREAAATREITGFFNVLADLLCPVFVERDAVVYRTAWHPDGCPDRTPPEVAPSVYQVDLGAAEDVRYTGWGWYWPEDAGGLSIRWMGELSQADLYVDLPPGSYDLTLSAQAFEHDRRVTVSVNGVEVDTDEVSAAGLAEYSFEIPSALVGDGRHLTLTFAYDETLKAPGGRTLAVMVDWVRIERVTD